MLMMKSVAFIMGCCFVLVLRMGEYNELTGHLKNRGKDWPNSRMNSQQHGENDADQTEFQGFFVTAIERPPMLDRTRDYA
jgi:hypothetical protein